MPTQASRIGNANACETEVAPAAASAVDARAAQRIGTPLAAEIGTTAPREAEWRAIVDTLPPQSRFATAAWFRAWGASFLPYQDWQPPLRYMSIRAEDGTLRASIPFAAQRKTGISVASLAGFYWPYRTPVFPEQAEACVFDAAADAFTRSRWTLALRCGPVAEGDGGIAGLMGALERRGWRIHCWPLGDTYAVDLPATWAAFELRLGKKLRTNARYYERKMAREGDLDIRRTTNAGSAAWAATIRDLGSVERRSWQQKEGGKSRFFGEPNQTFWTGLLSDPDAGRMASAWVMHFNGEAVSFCFCLDCGDTRHIVANHYAENVRQYGTGSILYRHVFRDAVESGAIRRVNIGLGDSGYKTRWGAELSFRLLDWMAFRPGTRGRLLEMATKFR
jgi:hypothetical protein